MDVDVENQKEKKEKENRTKTNWEGGYNQERMKTGEKDGLCTRVRRNG